jgi:alkylation response protein AidB-like acyl-CoA dehydrogenase
VRGERADCLAMTEPGAGSDLRGMKTFAVQDGGDWVINGTKHFISHADVADFVILFAATGEEDTPRGKKKLITAFLVDKGTPGFTVRPGYRNVSHRGYNNCILEFDGLPRAKPPRCWARCTRASRSPMTGSAPPACRSPPPASAAPSARSTTPSQWAAERQQFGQQIGKFQGVSFKLADMAMELKAAELADARSRLEVRPGHGHRHGHGHGQAQGHRDAGHGRRRGDPDPRRHGADGGSAAGAHLARCPGRAHLGGHQRDPAPHHLARAAEAAGG